MPFIGRLDFTALGGPCCKRTVEFNEDLKNWVVTNERTDMIDTRQQVVFSEEDAKAIATAYIDKRYPSIKSQGGRPEKEVTYCPTCGSIARVRKVEGATWSCDNCGADWCMMSNPAVAGKGESLVDVKRDRDVLESQFTRLYRLWVKANEQTERAIDMVSKLQLEREATRSQVPSTEGSEPAKPSTRKRLHCWHPHYGRLEYAIRVLVLSVENLLTTEQDPQNGTKRSGALRLCRMHIDEVFNELNDVNAEAGKEAGA